MTASSGERKLDASRATRAAPSCSSSPGSVRVSGSGLFVFGLEQLDLLERFFLFLGQHIDLAFAVRAGGDLGMAEDGLADLVHVDHVAITDRKSVGEGKRGDLG